MQTQLQTGIPFLVQCIGGIHLALLNSSIEAGILLCGNGALPRHGGRALSRACVTQLSALSSGCFSYTGSHSLLLLT